MYGANGILFKSIKLNTFGKKAEHSFDISNLKNGLYVYRIISEGINVSGKIHLNKL